MRIACLLLAAAACGHGSKAPAPAAEQTFHDGVQALCDLPDHVPDAPAPEQRLAGAGKWASEHVTNADARKLGSLDSISIDKEQLADAAQRAGLTRCKLLDNGMSLQSYADAMKVVCAAPLDHRDQLPAYLRAHLLNAEVIRLAESLGNLSPADATAKLRAASERAGVTDCAVLR